MSYFLTRNTSFTKVRNFKRKMRQKWDEMADWLHKNANAYQDALRRIMRGRLDGVRPLYSLQEIAERTDLR